MQVPSPKEIMLLFSLSGSSCSLRTCEPILTEQWQSQRCQSIPNTASVAPVRDGWEWCRSRPTCFVLGYLGWEGYGAHFREPEAVELDEGVKSPSVSHSKKQVIFTLINIQESFCNYLPIHSVLWHIFISLLVCLTISFSPLKIPLQTAGAQAHSTLNIPKHLCQREKQMA